MIPRSVEIPEQGLLSMHCQFFSFCLSLFLLLARVMG
jgi:hypothetical protein